MECVAVVAIKQKPGVHKLGSAQAGTADHTEQTNKQTKIEGVAAPRQLGRNDQTHRQNHLPSLDSWQQNHLHVLHPVQDAHY